MFNAECTVGRRHSRHPHLNYAAAGDGHVAKVPGHSTMHFGAFAQKGLNFRQISVYDPRALQDLPPPWVGSFDLTSGIIVHQRIEASKSTAVGSLVVFARLPGAIGKLQSKPWGLRDSDPSTVQAIQVWMGLEVPKLFSVFFPHWLHALPPHENTSKGPTQTMAPNSSRICDAH